MKWILNNIWKSVDWINLAQKMNKVGSSRKHVSGRAGCIKYAEFVDYLTKSCLRKDCVGGVSYLNIW